LPLATDQGHKVIESFTPMDRVSQPEEITETELWLSSARTSYIAGAVVPVDGGYFLPRRL
jgi:NAD(P)-dependent dehydrogenase (short-subunit alcohol dehydrogenase family)